MVVKRGRSVGQVGRFITRIRPGDKELWDRLVDEARHLCETGVPKEQAVERLIEIAGDNPRAFAGIGKSTQALPRTPEGRAVLRLLHLATFVWTNRRRGGAPSVWGRRPTSEETALAAMPVAQGFSELAQQEPKLFAIANEVIGVAETARSGGQDESSIRTAVLDIMLRISTTDP
jgi:hypothetical protein